VKLHLGVVDVPYMQAPKAPRRGRKRIGAKPKKMVAGTQTTGDIAEKLEARYHVMEHFVQLHSADVIAPALEKGLAGALETMMMGGQPTPALFASAEGIIEEGFRRMIEAKELDRLGYPGIPTRASLDGVSHRFKIKRGPVRPSFIDTGQYLAAFKTWAD